MRPYVVQNLTHRIRPKYATGTFRSSLKGRATSEGGTPNEEKQIRCFSRRNGLTGRGTVRAALVAARRSLRRRL